MRHSNLCFASLSSLKSTTVRSVLGWAVLSLAAGALVSCGSPDLTLTFTLPATAKVGDHLSIPIACVSANGFSVMLATNQYDDACGGNVSDKGDGTGTYTRQSQVPSAQWSA